MKTTRCPADPVEFTDQLVERLRHRQVCAWCCSDAKIYRSKLCRQCYTVSRWLAVAEKRAAATNHLTSHSAWQKKYQVRLFAKMRQLCKEDGDIFRRIASGQVSALDLEHHFSFLSKRLLRKDLFWGFASLLGSCFSSSQMRFLDYLLWKLISVANRRTRQEIAAFRLIAERQ